MLQCLCVLIVQESGSVPYLADKGTVFITMKISPPLAKEERTAQNAHNNMNINQNANLDLFDDLNKSKEQKKVLVVDTVPKDARNQGSINLGLEIVKDKMDADVCHWWEMVPNVGKYELIGFNVFYPTALLNIVPFLRKNNLSLLKPGRGIKTIAGGPGIGHNNILGGIIDETFLGEYDEFENIKEITSKPYFKGNKAVIELTRGCRSRCHFCEYIWSNPSNRQKPIELVKEQIDYVVSKGIRNINFMSANFTGYHHVQELAPYAASKGVVIKNSDITIRDAHNIFPILKYLPKYLKMGVESFDEKTRIKIGKKFTDEHLFLTIKKLLRHCSDLHFYLIYGLPDDDYTKWFKWLKILGDLRKTYRHKVPNLFNPEGELENTKPIRFEFSMTNFEPADGTLLESANQVDFKEKNKFLKKWFSALIENGFVDKKLKGRLDYKNFKGRIGRKKKSYDLLMELKKGGPELTDHLVNVYPNGVGRSISDDESMKFLNFRQKKERTVQNAQIRSR